MSFVVEQDKLTGEYSITKTTSSIVISTDHTSKAFNTFQAARQHVIGELQKRIDALLETRGKFMIMKESDMQGTRAHA